MTRHHVLRRRLQDVHQAAVEGISLAWLRSAADHLFSHLVHLGIEQGVGHDWCEDQLDQGAECVLALAPDGKPVGMGLVTRDRFWVEEILHMLDPTPEGVYLYATYVTPDFRGRHIQQSLDTARMLRMRDRAAHVAYAVVDASNQPSVRGHHRGGFQPAATVRLWRRHAKALAHVRFHEPGLQRLLPHDGLKFAGWRFLRIPPQ